MAKSQCTTLLINDEHNVLYDEIFVKHNLIHYLYIIKLKQRYENENQQIATFQNGMVNV